jgi:hypothetical protein
MAKSGESSSEEGTAADDISKDGMLQSGEERLGCGEETSWKEETVPSGVEGSCDVVDRSLKEETVQSAEEVMGGGVETF